MGNIGPLLDTYPGLRIIGDLRNSHLYYPRALERMQTVRAGDSLDLGGRRVQFVRAFVHDLPNTLWGYDPDEGILFVSDAYPYTHDHEVGQCALTSEELPGEIRPEDTSIVIGRALNWAHYVDAAGMMRELRHFFDSHPVHRSRPPMVKSLPILRRSRASLSWVCSARDWPDVSRIERISEDVLVLTDLVPIDGRVSWLPAGARGLEPYNAYVVLSDDRALLIDTGVALHEEFVAPNVARGNRFPSARRFHYPDRA